MGNKRTDEILADERPNDTDEKRQQIRGNLEARGVSPKFSDSVAERLASLVDVLDQEPFEAVVEGVVLAYTVHQDDERFVERSRKDLVEVGRLMKGFSGELKKLDEALQILAAYVSRMKLQTSDEGAQTLH